MKTISWQIWYDSLTPYDPPYFEEDKEELDPEDNPLADLR